MKKVITYLTIILTSLCCLLSFSNIEAQKDYNIIGRWKPANTDSIIRFYKDGEFETVGVKGQYKYNGERLILDLPRGYKYRTITTLNAFIENDKLYLAYPSKGYLIGNKQNDGLVGEWEAYRWFQMLNSKTNYVYEDRWEYIKLKFWKGYLTITQGYDTYEERYNSFSYKTAYDDIVDRHYFYNIHHPEDRTYYEIVELEDKKLLLLSHKYIIENGRTVSVTFNYPYYTKD